jgi:hypothetical protein
MTDRKQNRTENGTDRLQEIRARLDAATPGPWLYPEDDPTRIQASDGVSVAVITRRVDDADLIAHAPADLAWLLDKVEELTKRVRMYEVVKS